MSVYTDNAAAFSTTADQRVRELRRQGIDEALGWLVAGHPEIAGTVMLTTLHAQARVAGIRALDQVGGAA